MHKTQIIAIGRSRAGPEAALIEDYLGRFANTGRAFGFDPIEHKELEARKSNPDEEARLLSAAIPKASTCIALDERGKAMTSPEFSTLLTKLRDSGPSTTSFVIGGADGLHPDVLARANHKLSFGRMVWPHMLARVMLAEQLYRAVAIMGNTPYHRA